MNNRKIRTRIAPSPTGYATVGNLRTALFNYLFAKKHGGEFLIRIEDTDETRFVDGAEKYIIDSLAWLGIKPDVGIKPDGTAEFRQSEREYRSYADLLVSNGHAYYAFDTSEELDTMKKRADASGVKTGYNSISRMNMKNSFTMSDEEVKSKISSGDSFVIRFNTPRNKTITFKDAVKGNVSFDSNNLDDKVLFKSSGMVAYHLANVIDDHLMEITHVIRGDEWVSSTPLHVMLYEAFGWDKPEFCHVPLVLGPDKKKLSKRKMKEYGFTVFPLACSYVDDKGNNISVPGFKDEGYEPDALINFLALLGWNPGGTEEIMSMDRMIELFELDRINNSGAMFDVDKLKNFNAHYLRSRNPDILLSQYILPTFKSNVIEEWKFVDKIYNESELNSIVEIAKERSVFGKDLYSTVSYFFEPVVLKDDVVLKNNEEFSKVMESLLGSDLTTKDWTADFIKADLESFCEVFGFKMGKILPDLRMALTGGIPGPHLPETMEILGREESINRIKNLIKKTEKVAG